MKPRVVLSGVNLVDMGPLTVFKDALASLALRYGDQFEIVALVHRADRFDTANVTYLEYPRIKSSWLRRLRFEYIECRRLSVELEPELWLSMHDISPNVVAKSRAVYCHNPAPFYRFTLGESLFDWKFGAFTLLYRFLYGVNIQKNDFVVVQQSWLRQEFKKRYGVSRVIVAHPDVKAVECSLDTRSPDRIGEKYYFFYPAYPRTFKNLEIVLDAARELEASGFCEFEIWLTVDGTVNRYAESIVRRYGDVRSVRWLGLLSRDEVFQRYGEADCLLFPSKLESWGLPITEFKTTGKPILAADLPYAHETVGDYGRAAFFTATDSSALAQLMKSAAVGADVFRATAASPIAPLFAKDWAALWRILLESRVAERSTLLPEPTVIERIEH